MIVGIDATFFWKSYDGGKEQVLYNLLRGFEKIGVGNNIFIFCYKNRADILKKYAPNAKFYILKDLYYEKDNKLKYVLSNIKRLYFENIVLPKLIEKYNIDIIFFTLFGSTWKNLKIPSVLIPHDIQSQSHPERFNRKVYYYIKLLLNFDFKYRDKIIAISDFDKKEMMEYFPRYKDKIVRIYNPIFYEEGVSKGIKKDIVGLNIGGSHKNILTLIKAFDLIKNKVNENLILIGKKNKNVEELIKFVNKNNLSNRVFFTGYLNEKEMIRLLRNSKLYVNPSLYEGFGMTAIEAMIYGVPTIVSKVTSMPEVTMGMCIYYEDPLDEKKLAEKILYCLSKYPDIKKLQNISEIMKRSYGIDKIAMDYWSLFEKL